MNDKVEANLEWKDEVLSNLQGWGWVKAGEISTLHYRPDKVGESHFSCDVFCGDGHEDMTGTVIVKEKELMSGMENVAIRAPWLHSAFNS